MTKLPPQMFSATSVFMLLGAENGFDRGLDVQIYNLSFRTLRYVSNIGSQRVEHFLTVTLACSIALFLWSSFIKETLIMSPTSEIWDFKVVTAQFFRLLVNDHYESTIFSTLLPIRKPVYILPLPGSDMSGASNGRLASNIIEVNMSMTHNVKRKEKEQTSFSQQFADKSASNRYGL
jgi:hypothetical protein